MSNLHKKNSSQKIACIPKKVLDQIVNSAVWVSNEKPIFSDNNTKLLFRDAHLLNLPGTNTPASVGDLLSLNPDIQFKSSKYIKNKTNRDKVAQCFEGFSEEVYILLTPDRVGF